MPTSPSEYRPFLLSTQTASRGERRLALAAVAVSLLLFAALAPFARTQLLPVPAFIPAYEASLVVLDLITVSLLCGQYLSFHSRSLLVLAAGYLFSALTTGVHALTFPGLFSPSGLLGAGPQSTAWLYMFWHGGFPLFVVAYALLKRLDGTAREAGKRSPKWRLSALLAVPVVVGGLTALTTVGQSLLPAIMEGNRYTPAMIVVVSSVWTLSLVALAVLWLRKPHSVLDLWLMVVICAWLVDIALSAVLNQGRFDLGFYAGRIYGLLAASFVLLVLLAESGILYRKLMQLTAKLKQLTLQDALTGIANRRAFDAALDLEWQHAMRSGQPLSLIMIDVDHFKPFNDHYGHVEGDKCLQAVAAVLRASATRAIDLAARYGGEEFAVLLPQTDAATAGRLAECIREGVAVLAIRNPASPDGCVTVSIGVADVHGSRTVPQAAPAAAGHPGGQALVRMADEMLYAAKSAGRNRVVIKEVKELAN
ncbi:MAG: GGDEF domain-containing protein [Rhodocyclales bacterium]|nr:GGDEF domain-containing protein [Rhodocyclales bacterium]